MTRAGVFGVGAALPEHVVTNDDWARRLDTSDEWIVRRTGIRTRHWMNGDGPLASFAARACLAALEDAGRTPDEVDYVIVSSVSPDRVFPGMAPDVVREIGAGEAAAVDINAACAGFLYGLDQAAALVESGRARCVLVCGAEAMSRLTDETDRGTAVLFGDGAGAVVVAGGEFEHGCGVFELHADGTHRDALYADNDDRVVRMAGQEVYRHAIARMVESLSVALRRAGLRADDLDLLVAHQANARILDAMAAELGIPGERVICDIDRVANTSSASIPLALTRARDEGLLHDGSLLGLTAFGGGFVWGAGIMSFKERAGVLF